MAESGAKIVFRGDAKHLVGEAKKGEAAVEMIGTKAGKANNQFRQMGQELGKAVGRALALKVALAAAVSGFKEFQSAQAGASRKSGASVLERDLAGAKLGLSSGDAESITGAIGVRSRDELTGFLTNLGTGDAAKRMDRGTTFKASALFSSGLFSESEIMEAAKTGRLDQLQAQTAARQASLSPDAQREQSIRVAENASAARKFDADRQRGTEQRLAEAKYSALAAESPIAGAVANNLPGGVGAEIAQVFNSALDNQTDRLVSEGRQPTLAPGSDQ